MAYNVIPSSWIDVGKAIKKRMVSRLVANLEDHESRINNIEAGTSKVELFNFEVMGHVDHHPASKLLQIGTYKANTDFTITEAKLVLMNNTAYPTSSSTGVLEIDLEKSTDNGLTWNSILQKRPTIEDGVSSTGSESLLIQFVTGGETINAGETVRVSVTSKKDTQGSFLIYVYGDLS